MSLRTTLVVFSGRESLSAVRRVGRRPKTVKSHVPFERCFNGREEKWGACPPSVVILTFCRARESEVTVAFVILAVTAAILGGLALLFAWVRRLRVEAAETLRGAVGGEKVLRMEDCNFFGLLSEGHAQVRGNGMLALTDRGIHFRMLYPRRYLHISVDAVTAVSTSRSFLGKWRGKDLLRIDFTRQDGSGDACAFLLRSPRDWANALEGLLSHPGSA